MTYTAPVMLMLALQTTPVALGPLTSLGLAGVVIYLWQMDRKDRRIQDLESRRQYQELAQDFRLIVQENTKAVQALTDSVTGVRCPLAGGALAGALRTQEAQNILIKLTQGPQ